MFCRAANRFGCFINASLLEVCASQIQRTIEPPELLHFLESFRGLAQLGLAFDQQPDAVVVPSLPGGNVAVCIGWLRIDSDNRERDAVHRQRRDRQLIDIALARFVTAYRLSS